MQLARSGDHRAWFIAWSLALALHVAAVLGMRNVPSPSPPKTIHPPTPVRLVFTPAGAEPRESEKSLYFSELPPDREDAAPAHPDFLSNVTSRARDAVPGGEDALPRMQGESSFPAVKIEPDGAPPRAAPSSAPTPPVSEATAPRAMGAKAGAGAVASDRSLGPSSGLATSAPTRPDASRSGSDDSPRESVGSGLGSDLPQPEMANPYGNAPLAGDVSLNTTAWDYAPWLHRFGRRLMDRWFAPPAYTFGILKEGGWALFEVEISRDGKMLRLEQLEEQGHPSLSRAAQSALRSVAPIEPLPADFPEPTLILRLRMIYPRVRPQ